MSVVAKWLNGLLGREVGFSPGDLVLDGDPAHPSQKGAEPPNFQPMSAVAKRLDGSRWHYAWRWPCPGHIVPDGDPAPVPKEGGRAQF